MKEKELNCMPERSVLGKQAIDYLGIKDSIEKDRERLAECSEKLVGIFKKEGKTMISVMGRTVKMEHVNKDQIRVVDTRG